MELDKNGNFLFASDSVKLVIPLTTPISLGNSILDSSYYSFASEIQAWKVFLGDIQS